MDRWYIDRVGMSAAASIQIHNAQKYSREEQSWVADVRPCLALYLLLAVDDQEHAPDWVVGYMIDTGVLCDADKWEPSRMAIASLVKMRKHTLVSQYRHGAIVYRLLAKRLVRVDAATGALVVLSPSLMWERVDMMSRLYDEATERLWAMVERWGNE